jgi:hypothetical protein
MDELQELDMKYEDFLYFPENLEPQKNMPHLIKSPEFRNNTQGHHSISLQHSEFS